MKIAQIVHNPTAGDAGHEKEELLEIVKEDSYIVNYVSTHTEGWEDFYRNKMDVIILAGGDGTIHKLAGVFLKNSKAQNKIPIYLLPLGTANNIARTLGISASTEKHIIDAEGDNQKFDVGSVDGLNNHQLFLESAGLGIFPELIAEMKANPIENEQTSEKLERTLKTLLEIVKNHKPEKAKIKADGMTIKGSFLLVELMNIKYIGPGIKLAPNARTNDAYFDLVLIPEQYRAELKDYLQKMVEEKSERANLEKFVKTIRAQKVKMKYKGSKIHVDDNLIDDYAGKSFTLEVKPRALEFINKD